MFRGGVLNHCSYMLTHLHSWRGGGDYWWLTESGCFWLFAPGGWDTQTLVAMMEFISTVCMCPLTPQVEGTVKYCSCTFTPCKLGGVVRRIEGGCCIIYGSEQLIEPACTLCTHSSFTKCYICESLEARDPK